MILLRFATFQSPLGRHLASFFLVWSLGLLPGAAWGASLGQEGYADLLDAHVRAGRVDYAGLKKKEADLDRHLDALAQIEPESLPADEQFAFYVNAYNAWTLKLALTHYPGLRSIKDAGSLLSSPWKIKLVRLNSGLFTLDQIEHEILRPRFKDPRVHFAVNCASKSCPPLRSEPYEGAKLQAQLDDAARGFINSPEGALVKDGALYLSKIFDWYAEDFGGRQGSLVFVRSYANQELSRRIEALGDSPRLKYLEYDWRLNGE